MCKMKPTCDQETPNPLTTRLSSPLFFYDTGTVNTMLVSILRQVIRSFYLCTDSRYTVLCVPLNNTKGDLTPMPYAICDIAKKYHFAIRHIKNNRNSYTDATRYRILQYSSNSYRMRYGRNVARKFYHFRCIFGVFLVV